MIRYYKRDECLYRTRDDLSKRGELSRRVLSVSRNAVSMPRESLWSDVSSGAEVQVYVLFFRRLYQSVREL